MPPALIHHLTGDAPSTAAVVCGDPAATSASFDLDRVTCPACRRHCTCGPTVPLCPSCRAYNARRVGRPQSLPPLRTEKQFQEALRQLARANGFLYFHVLDSRRNPTGWVDTVLAKPGHPLYLCELKTATGALSATQQEWGRVLSQLTEVTYEVWYPADWERIVERLQ